MRYTLTLVVLLTACGAAPAAVTPSSPASVASIPSATATATPTPTEWTKAEAAARYLALVKPSNDARAAVSAFAGAHPRDAKGAATLCRTLAAELKVFLDGLAVGLWPTDVRPAVGDVMSSVGAQMNAALACGAARTVGDVNAAWDYADPHSGAAQVLRARLGLPEAP